MKDQKKPIVSTYDESSISALGPMEAIRKRPGMYIGNTGVEGLHHLIKEAIDNALDEAIAGAATRCEVTFHPDGSVSISDDGRGIPTGPHPQAGTGAIPAGMKTLEVVMSITHAGGKFSTTSEDSGYRFQRSGAAAGLHGIGIKAITALSEWVECRVSRGGTLTTIRFERGVRTSLVDVPKDDPATGTTFHFLPDDQIFESLDWDTKVIAARLEDVSYLKPGFRTIMNDDRSGTRKTQEWHSKKGLSGLIDKVLVDKDPLFPPISVSVEAETVVKRGSLKDRVVSIATSVHFTYVKSSSSAIIRSYANNVSTPGGGTHLKGFEAALYDVASWLVSDDQRLTGIKTELQESDVREGVVAVISTYIPEPEFLGQTKDRLGNVEVKQVVKDSVVKALEKALEKDPTIADAIREKMVEAILARDASAKARANAQRKGVFERVSLPGKLVDCISKDVLSTELWVVEGDSAAGSAETGRDVKFQAVLGLKGKVLNTYGETINRALENKEIKDLMMAIGLKVYADKETKERGLQYEPRYGKIILAMDADADGDHIQCLLLAFFYRFAPQLIREGVIYCAEPPLFKAAKKGGVKVNPKNTQYFHREEDLAEWKSRVDSSKYDVSRFKGLGEMDDVELGWTTMNPTNRTLTRLAMTEAERSAAIFEMMLGSDSAPRKRYLESHALDIEVEL